MTGFYISAIITQLIAAYALHAGHEAYALSLLLCSAALDAAIVAYYIGSGKAP